MYVPNLRSSAGGWGPVSRLRPRGAGALEILRAPVPTPLARLLLAGELTNPPLNLSPVGEKRLRRWLRTALTQRAQTVALSHEYFRSRWS